jgi:site-specific recombinase XerD
MPPILPIPGPARHRKPALMIRSNYLRSRKAYPLAREGGRHSSALWLGASGIPLTASGLFQMLARRAKQAGIGHIHPHQLRHTSAHNWLLSGWE